MTITAQAVKQLRDKTGAGMMDCKKALTEADGDMDQAIKILRTKGLSAAAKKAHRTASDGVVKVVGDSSKMAILELNCETEPVSKLDDFQAFADALASQALASDATDADQLKAQPFADEPEHTVEESISLKIAVIGENIVLSRCSVLAAAPGHKLGSYVHMGGKIGVVVEASEGVSDEVLHDVAMHVAAADPRFATRDEVTEATLAAEKEIALKQAMDQGKPEHIAERIVAGKMEKYFEENVLLEQPFAKDTSMTVGEHLRSSGGATATVSRFVRYRLGEEAGE
jgi:elongation factor Ts